MTRTPQKPQPITHEDFVLATVRLRTVLEAVERAATSVKPNDELGVIYAASLERGLKSLEAVEPEIRRALAIYDMRQQVAAKSSGRLRTASQIAEEHPDDSALFEEIEREANRGATKKKVTAQPATRGRKRKSG